MIATVAKDISSTDTLTAAVGNLRVLMAAGGTGGHVYPAIAIADAIKEMHSDAEFLFVGTRDRMEWEIVPKYGYKIKSIWISGVHRRLTIQNLLFPAKLVTSIIQSFLILKSFKPDIVIACGGFASGPIGWVAVKLGIPLFLQEQNSFPGVTNRMLAKHATTIFTAFDDAKQYLPEEKIKLTGNPVRGQVQVSNRSKALQSFNFTEDLPVLLILGGSGGAKALNDIMTQEIEQLHDSANLQIIWQCGPKYFDGLIEKVKPERFHNLRLTAFIDDMSAAYAVADLVVTRAGAGTCSELETIGQPAILVPSPNVAGDHQTKNAQSLVHAGAAKLLKEETLQHSFYSIVTELIRDKNELSSMSSAMKSLAKPKASEEIATEIFSFLKNQN
ncbi:undecaprenyldiphospho-muramoylpentapeptide beta-N-acetylglucosaminyltransferase [Rhodohalobacter sp. 614A]|uniref:undecaprenyldiphospho-muramoylpentapeptide beta-N-acetylglucosaminyltransferase n=1 Tax=Rhodohalobacter sp. 614A TaxID=2908649 RepID=UPI001F3AB094|nr:undecaprenyldiphospho-muramoylpentapeptide beta-N-acetylglucosaminyltransferase [Rhodohalobacter sp. 614A]